MVEAGKLHTYTVQVVRVLFNVHVSSANQVIEDAKIVLFSDRIAVFKTHLMTKWNYLQSATMFQLDKSFILKRVRLIFIVFCSQRDKGGCRCDLIKALLKISRRHLPPN